MPAPDPESTIYTPSQLNREARSVLERGLGVLWVSGEVSNLATPASGHAYFTLKDASAQVRCTLFRQYRMRSPVRLREGMEVLVRGRPSVYEQRGDFQIQAEYVEESGEGRLRQAFEDLKRRLSAEGLFDTAAKKPLPRFPGTLAVITSSTGAALRDVISVLERRYPCIQVRLHHSAVQGAEAPAALLAALRQVESGSPPDVVLLTRGGGSMEDLWAFNDETLVRAVAASPLTIVAAVGHEIDVTLCDFAADVRAPTPSAAAELIVPDRGEVLQMLDHWATGLERAIQRRLALHRATVAHLCKRLRSREPRLRLNEDRKRLESLRLQLSQRAAARLDTRRHRLRVLQARLAAASPKRHLTRLAERLVLHRQRLWPLTRRDLAQRHRQLDHLARSLHTVSPLAVLQRGYSVTRFEDGRVIRGSDQVKSGDRIVTRVGEGQFNSIVE